MKQSSHSVRRIALYGDPEHIARADLVHFALKDVDVRGPLGETKVSLHHQVCERFIALAMAWHEADAWRHVLTWDRSYHAAQVRPGRWGAHAWGNAFDCNTQWNPLGTYGAKRGELGSTHELEEIAKRIGWTCGRSFFAGRAARHFELLTPAPG